MHTLHHLLVLVKAEMYTEASSNRNEAREKEIEKEAVVSVLDVYLVNSENKDNKKEANDGKQSEFAIFCNEYLAEKKGYGSCDNKEHSSSNRNQVIEREDKENAQTHQRLVEMKQMYQFFKREKERGMKRNGLVINYYSII